MRNEEYHSAIECFTCKKKLHDSEVIYATENGILNTDVGNPYCDRCLPEEKYIYTLKTLYDQHPEWHNLKIAVMRRDGNLDYVGENMGAGSVFTCKEECPELQDVLIFCTN